MTKRPVRPLRIVVIGCGDWGRKIAHNFLDLGALAGIVGRTPESLSELSWRLGVPSLSLNDTLKSKEIDGVVIATPSSTHTALAIKAINAKKHVLLEKPGAVDRSQLRALSEAASKSEGIFMGGHLLRYDPDFEALFEIVQKLSLIHI